MTARLNARNALLMRSVALALGWAALSTPVAAVAGERDAAVAGYLLRQTTDKLQKIHMVGFIRTMESEEEALIREASDLSKATLALEPPVTEKNPLPRAEQWARERIESESRDQILWGNNIEVRRRLVTKVLQSAGYCHELCGIIAENVTGERRQAFKKMADRWAALERRAFALVSSIDKRA